MLRNYIITALRHLLKNRGATSINIVGLALGIACSLVILVVVRYERSYDQFHSKADRIYRVVRVSQGDGETEYRTGVPYAVPGGLKERLTAAQEVTATMYIGGMQVSVVHEADEVRQEFQEANGITFADPAFFRLFDFKDTDVHWIAGDPETALEEPFTVVLTQSLAEKYFPEEEALGKILTLDNLLDVTVTGVMSDLPPNSDFPFRIMVSHATLNTEILMKDDFSNWYSVSDEHQCYVLLNEGIASEEAEAQILKIHAAQVDERLAETRLYKLQPLRELHTDARFGNYQSRTVSPETIWALLIIGLFMIGTAVINFVNLSTAQSVLRSKEVGIRKAIGSSRVQLTTQFLGETFIITLIAGILALGTAELVTVYAGDLLQVESESALSTDLFILPFVLFIVVGVALLAGTYPALMMSSFNPIAALKNKLGGSFQRGMRLRRGLVALQFIISQVFIIGTIVVVRQMDYFRNADLGFDQEAVVTVRLPEGKTPDLSTLEALANRWKSMPSVKAVSFASSSPAGVGRSTSTWDIRMKGAPEKSESIVFERQAVDEQYLELFQIPLVAGRNFLPNDTAQRIIINRKLSERVGFSEPSEALEETMLIGDQSLTVIGVAENFHTQSLRGDIDHVGLIMAPKDYNTANVKLNLNSSTTGSSGNLSETLQQLEAPWAAIYPNYIFDYHFLDESIAAYYQEEVRLSQLFKILAGITIFIGCLGLYGLVAFMAVRRTKEVGIRKVLGASVRHILVLFSKEFVYLILIAFCVAAPIAWYVMRLWLQNFTYQVDLGIGTFLIAILASLFIALLTVGYRAIQAATANPVDSLRNE